MRKIIIVTDSTGLSRNNFSSSKSYFYDQTFPFLLKQEFKEDLIYQLSYGGVSTQDLLLQIQSYFISWKPDIIIIHSGINECKPQILSMKNLQLLSKLFGRYNFFIKKFLFNPFLIKFLGRTIDSPIEFKKKILIFKSFFDTSEIYMNQIICDQKLELRFPNVLNNLLKLNKLLKDIFKENYVDLNDYNTDCFLDDGLHLSSKGHYFIYEKIKNKIKKK